MSDVLAEPAELTAGVALPKDDGDPVCGECGSRIGDVTLHTKYHAGAEQLDAQQLVLDFLAGIDPAELQTAVMAVLEEHDVSPIVATLDVIKATAARA